MQQIYANMARPYQRIRVETLDETYDGTVQSIHSLDENSLLFVILDKVWGRTFVILSAEEIVEKETQTFL